MRDPYKEVNTIIRSQLARLERDVFLLANAASVSFEKISTMEVGLSTDEKPTNVHNGRIFFEVDTGITYIFHDEGKKWIPEFTSTSGTYTKSIVPPTSEYPPMPSTCKKEKHQCQECKYYVPFTGESGKCYVKDRYVPHKDSCESWIMRSHSCQECEFYCHTPPNEGLCNVTLGKALGRGVCRNFVPQLHRSKSSDAKKASSCFSCGTPLEIEIHGRRKYCAHCGCYLPEIIYDHRFTELVKPMDSVKPSRLGTVYTH